MQHLGPKDLQEHTILRWSGLIKFAALNLIIEIFRLYNYIFGDHLWYDNNTGRMIVHHYNNLSDNDPKVLDPILIGTISHLYHQLGFRSKDTHSSCQSGLENPLKIWDTRLARLKGIENPAEQNKANPNLTSPESLALFHRFNKDMLSEIFKFISITGRQSLKLNRLFRLAVAQTDEATKVLDLSARPLKLVKIPLILHRFPHITNISIKLSGSPKITGFLGNNRIQGMFYTDSYLHIIADHFKKSSGITIDRLEIVPNGIQATDKGLAKLADMSVKTLKLQEHVTQLALSSLVNLEELDLTGTYAIGQANRKIAIATTTFTGIPTLRILNLSKTCINDINVTHLANMQSLTHLDLSETNITGTGFAHFQAPLKNLQLTKCQRLTLEGMQAISALDLEMLGASETKLADQQIEPLMQMLSLRVLKLAGARITGTGLTHLTAPLEEIDLSSTGINDNALIPLANTNSLKKINISGCPKVTDIGVGLLGLLNLDVLNLSRTQIHGEGFQLFNPIGALDISDCYNITNRSFLSLPPIKNLNTSRCFNLNDSAISYLRAMPKLKILNITSSQVTHFSLLSIATMPSIRKLFLGSNIPSEVIISYFRGSSLEEVNINGKSFSPF